MRKTAGVFVLVFFVAGVAALAATKTLNVRQPDASMGTGFLVFKIGELKNCVLDCRNDLSQMAAKGYQGPVKIQITDSSGRRIVADLGRIDNIESPSRINWNHRTAGGDSLLVKINDAGFLSVAQRYFEQNQYGAKIAGYYTMKLICQGIDGESKDKIVQSPEVKVAFQISK